jgi:hypothetical protein
MPSVSGKQHRLMAAVANNPKFAKKAGVPQSVGAEFMKADKGRKFKEGGEMKESKAMMKKEVSFMKKAGAPRSMIKHEESEMKGMKMKKMAGGGITTAKMGTVKTAAPSRDGVATKGKTKGTMVRRQVLKWLKPEQGGV